MYQNKLYNLNSDYNTFKHMNLDIWLKKERSPE